MLLKRQITGARNDKKIWKERYKECDENMERWKYKSASIYSKEYWVSI